MIRAAKRADPSTLKTYTVEARATPTAPAYPLGTYTAQSSTGAIVQAAHALARGRVSVFSVTAKMKGE